jgi:hypothetical protein
MESEKPKLTPAEELFQRLERPLRNIDVVSELNNDAVALFAEGKLSLEQLTKFSMGLARQADALAKRIYKTDIKENPMPETKQLAYSSMQALAQENRNRAMILTLEAVFINGQAGRWRQPNK